MSRILTRFPSLHGKELSLKYADTLNDWIELPADDIDSFVDMIETAKDSARENCKTTELKVCELAQTPKQTAQERLRSSSSPNYESTSESVHVAKNQPARRLDEEFTCSLNETTDDIEYESPTEKIFEKLEQQKHDVEQLSIKATRGIWAREPFQAGAWFFKETVVFKLSYFRAQQNYVLRCTLLFRYNM